MNMTTKATLGSAIALMMVAMILSLKNHSEKKEALIALKYVTQENDFLKRQSNPAAMPTEANEILRGQIATQKEENDRIAAQLEEARIKASEDTKLTQVVENQEKVRNEQLTPLALKIKAMPSIGSVIEANADWGILSFDAGSDSGVASGMPFAVRREHYIIAQVKVQTAEAGKSIADIVGKVAEGMQIQAGDDIISYPVQ